MGTLLPLAMTMGLLLVQEEKTATLACTVAPEKNRLQARLEGTVPLPDGAVLNVSLDRLEERAVSGILESKPTGGGRSVRVVVAGKKIRLEPEGLEPGEYRVMVRRSDDSGKTEGEFRFAMWNDAFVARFGTGLGEIDERVVETSKFIQKLSDAAVSRAAWQEALPELRREGAGLLRKLGRAEARKLYPASLKILQGILQNVQGSLSLVKFTEEGALAGVENYHLKDKARTPSGKEFTFDNVKKDVEEAAALAGREFALWILKDLRRAGAREALVDIVKKHAGHPGVTLFAERLEQPEDLDRLETATRGIEVKKP